MTIQRQKLAQLAKQQPHTSRQYHNLEPTPRHGLREFLRWQREHGWRFPKGQPFPVTTPNSAELFTAAKQPRLTWLGHASFLFQYQGINLLTDPVFSPRCSPFSFMGPKRYTPAPMQVADLPPIQLVCISHNHYDHLDEASVVALAKRFGDSLTFLVPSGVAQWFQRRGIQQVIEMGWWEQRQLSGVEAVFVPAQHFSGRGLRDGNATLWGGWWLVFPDYSLYFAGDSGYGSVFQQMQQVLGSPDLALLPIGAYQPRWMMQGVHVNPEDAVEIHRDLQARQSVAMHWGTFVLTDEPMDEPPKKLRTAMRKHNVPETEFIVMQHGETRTFGH